MLTSHIPFASACTGMPAVVLGLSKAHAPKKPRYGSDYLRRHTLVQDRTIMSRTKRVLVSVGDRGCSRMTEPGRCQP